MVVEERVTVQDLLATHVERQAILRKIARKTREERSDHPQVPAHAAKRADTGGVNAALSMIRTGT